MAPAQGQNLDNIPLGSIPTQVLQQGIAKEDVDAGKIASDWLSKLAFRFEQRIFDDLTELFIEDCWWRDIVGLAWDLTTKHGQDDVSNYLATASNPFTDVKLVKSGGLQPALVEVGGMVWIQSGFTFRNAHGLGTGVVRLANDSGSKWKAWIVYTQLESLNEPKDLESHSDQVFDPTKPDDLKIEVLIVGCGQSALALGARLKRMGIKALLVGKGSQVGDVWRGRYKSIKLHTPRYTDHYPFMKYSDDLPTYLSRDQVVEFMEHYAESMKLDILFNTEVTRLKYVKEKKAYLIQAQTIHGPVTFSPQHVVLATGAFANEPIMPDIPGIDSFRGNLYHSREHRTADDVPNIGSKRVAIIGAGTSAHDIAHDFVTAGAAEVSMIQRGAIFTVSREAMEAVMLAGWNTPGINTEEADVLGNSMPTALVRGMASGMSQMMSSIDQSMLGGLRKAGLAVKTGIEGPGSSLLDHQLIKGGHFYIDQGANQMIIDRKIKIHQCDDGIREITDHGLVLANGVEVDADVLIVATGFQFNNTIVAKFLGEEIERKMDAFGFLDDEQERGGLWRQTGAPGFWYMTGSFMWSRQFSLSLALQIAAVIRGSNETYYETQKLLD